MRIEDIFDAIISYKIPFWGVLGTMIIAIICIIPDRSLKEKDPPEK